MNPTQYQVRRATVDDLEALRILWREARLPGGQLEKRLTEFHVALDATGELLGAVGLHLANHHGLIHSEAFLRPDLEDALRPQLWERLQVLARNFGLVRFWTLEEAPFWRHYAGFKPPLAGDWKGWPASFGEQNERCLTLPLREESTALVSLEKELELLHLAHQESMENIRRQARYTKNLVTVFVVLLIMVLLLAGIFLYRQRPTLER